MMIKKPYQVPDKIGIGRVFYLCSVRVDFKKLVFLIDKLYAYVYNVLVQ